MGDVGSRKDCLTPSAFTILRKKMKRENQARKWNLAFRSIPYPALYGPSSLATNIFDKPLPPSHQRDRFLDGRYVLRRACI